MSSAKAQKDRIIKLNIKDKKLTRLFHNKKLTQQDSVLINLIYEEKQHLNFGYAIMGNAFACILANFALFRTNGVLLQCVFFCSSFAATNFWIRRKVDDRFYSLLNPYFEKYQIK